MHATRPLHLLRTSTRIARLVLAWFVLALGVATAAPVVQPRAMDMVCTAGGGITMLAVDADGQSDLPGTHTLDCALCLSAIGPTASAAAAPPRLRPVVKPPPRRTVAWQAETAGAPLPPRGPPASC